MGFRISEISNKINAKTKKIIIICSASGLLIVASYIFYSWRRDRYLINEIIKNIIKSKQEEKKQNENFKASLIEVQKKLVNFYGQKLFFHHIFRTIILVLIAFGILETIVLLLVKPFSEIFNFNAFNNIIAPRNDWFKASISLNYVVLVIFFLYIRFFWSIDEKMFNEQELRILSWIIGDINPQAKISGWKLWIFMNINEIIKNKIYYSIATVVLTLLLVGAAHKCSPNA